MQGSQHENKGPAVQLDGSHPECYLPCVSFEGCKRERVTNKVWGGPSILAVGRAPLPAGRGPRPLLSLLGPPGVCWLVSGGQARASEVGLMGRPVGPLWAEAPLGGVLSILRAPRHFA